MGKYIKVFNTHTEYNTFINGGGVELPNISHCINVNDVHYNEEERIVVKFNITSTDTPTKLTYNATSLAKISKIEIDGVILDPISETYTFDTIGEHTVKYTLVDPSEIGLRLFQGCDSITEVRIPKNIESVGAFAFNGCTNLSKINIPDTIDNFSTNVFQNCTSLPIENNIRYADTYAVEVIDSTQTDYTLKNGTKWIGYRLFSGNTSIESVSIPNTVTHIGTYAFANSNLTNITIPDSVTNIENQAFQRSGLVSVTIPDSVTSIGANAFNGSTNLQSVTIGNGINEIPQNCFGACSSLTNISIPNTVTTIAKNAFNGCGFTNITIPESVSSIGEIAFSACRSVNSITCLSMTAPTIENNTFTDIKSNGTLYVPQGSTGYDVWMGTGNYYLGKYGWTKVEQ